MRRFITALLCTGLLVGAPITLGPARAAGISTDGGLTPAQDRVILRARMAWLHRAASWGGMPAADMYMFPFVAAWGVLPDLTLMGRAAVVHRSMEMGGDPTTDSGLGDLLVQAKYKLYRWNSRSQVFGIAPTLGIEAPTGTDGFSSETWDLRVGAHVSYRWQRSFVDLTAAYVWNGMAGSDGEADPGDALELTLALSHIFPWPGHPEVALAPVLELATILDSVERGIGDDAFEAVTYVSPGLQVITRWVIFEALVQVPVWQDEAAGALERRLGLITGLRFLL